MGNERLRKGAFFICFSLNKKIYRLTISFRCNTFSSLRSRL